MSAELLSLLHHLPRSSAAADPMRVAVIGGAGYVGLVTGTCLAALGHQVACIDLELDKVATLRRGVSPFYEPGLDALIEKAAGRLSFTSEIAEGVAGAEIVFLAVGTPSLDDGRTDLTYLKAAVTAMSASLSPRSVVVIKSTVPAGTAGEIEELLRGRGSANSVASNPEFLREGSAISDFLRADRIVIGVADQRSEVFLRRLYAPLTSARIPLVVTSRTNAEMIKHAANSFLAVKVGFINEVADLAERIGGDVDEIARAIGLDERIGGHFLRAGPGFGGSCFPKDTRAFADIARRHGVPLRLVEAAIASNQTRLHGLGARIANAAGGDVAGLRIAVLGLAFKPNTDDLRESPAVPLLRDLLAHGAVIRACDPKATASALRLFPTLACFDDPYEACELADIAVIVTDWQAFRSLDLGRLRSIMAGDILVDFRNQFDPSEAAKSGLRYISVGRQIFPPSAVSGPSKVAVVAIHGRPAIVRRTQVPRRPRSEGTP